MLTVNWNGAPATATAEPALVNASGTWVVVVVVLDPDEARPVAGVEVGAFVVPAVVELERADARGEFAFGEAVLHAAARTARAPTERTMARVVRSSGPSGAPSGRPGSPWCRSEWTRIPSSLGPTSRRRTGASAYWAGGPAGDELPARDRRRTSEPAVPSPSG